MSKHNRSPKLPGQDSKRHNYSRANDMGNDIFDDPGTTDGEIQDSSSVDGNDSTPSSLNKVLDYFDSDDHVRYDREVDEQMDGGFQGKLRCANLLSAIVGNCGGKLDVKYDSVRAAKTVIDGKPGLKTILETAWSLQKYREIRLLGTSRRLRSYVPSANGFVKRPSAFRTPHPHSEARIQYSRSIYRAAADRCDDF
jgi:hypothetical protein